MAVQLLNLARASFRLGHGRLAVMTTVCDRVRKSPSVRFALRRAFSDDQTRDQDEEEIKYHAPPDYYAVLGVNKSSDGGQIKLAYFKKVSVIVF